MDYIWYNVFDHSCLCAHDLCNFKKEQMWICTVSTEPCRSPLHICLSALYTVCWLWQHFHLSCNLYNYLGHVLHGSYMGQTLLTADVFLSLLLNWLVSLQSHISWNHLPPNNLVWCRSWFGFSSCKSLTELNHFYNNHTVDIVLI